MFERFTERGRQVVVLAQDEARSLKHTYLGTEHLLLGLLREEEGLAARVLDTLDVTYDEVRAQVARIVGQGDEVVTGQIAFTPRAKKVLELALREALALDHNYVGTEHILLGLVRENEGVAARILLDLDADAGMIRNELTRLLSGPGRRGGSTGSASFVMGEGEEGRASGRRRSDDRPHLTVSCPSCAAPIEVVTTDRLNAQFQVSMEGSHVCPACGRRWAIMVSAAWTDPSPPTDADADLPSRLAVRRVFERAHFTMSCFRCHDAIERLTLDDATMPSIHAEADGDRTCPGCGKQWTISYSVTWEARTEQ